MAKSKYWNGSQWVVLGSDAEKIDYDNTLSSLTATNVKAALDELDSGLSSISYPVTSVNGEVGEVVLAPADIGAATAAEGVLATNALPISGGTLTGILYPQNNTSYTTGQARRIILSTGDPSGGGNGDIWIKYV